MLENNELFTRIREIRSKRQVIENLIHKIINSEMHSKEDKYFLAKTLEGLQKEEYDLLNKIQGDDD